MLVILSKAGTLITIPFIIAVESTCIKTNKFQTITRVNSYD